MRARNEGAASKKGSAFTFVLGMAVDSNARVIHASEQMRRRVGAAIINDEQFHIAWIVNVEDLVDSMLYSLLLVIHRHNDRQFQGLM